MATVKKGLLTKSGEWAKHLRKWGKRVFWKKERKEAKIPVAMNGKVIGYATKINIH